MDNVEKNNLKKETKNLHIGSRIKNGLKRTYGNLYAMFILFSYIIASSIAIYNVYESYTHSHGNPLDELSEDLLLTLAVVTALIILVITICLIGTPTGSLRTHRQLARIGFMNHAGEVPFLINVISGKNNDCFSLVFRGNGFSLPKWEDAKADIEAALDIKIVSIKKGASQNITIIEAVDFTSGLSEIIPWSDSLISTKDFLLAIGQTFKGVKYIDLNLIPHLLVGGSTGSGKSVLLKSLAWQCLRKGSQVILVDFKGGVDFVGIWRNKFNLITSIDGLIHSLEFALAEISRRKELFFNNCVKNIVEYNEVIGLGESMCQRIIICFDEVAEVLDKVGLTKDQKEKVLSIESMLATIARQGRAFGVNLILSTQRPDATIINGQIRNNIDGRICGRADDVLSKIILDSTIASDEISKHDRGLFIDNEGELIRGFFFNDRESS